MLWKIPSCFARQADSRSNPDRNAGSATRSSLLVAVASLLLLNAAIVPASHAQGGPAEAVSAGAAVAGVVVEVIGGLSSWVNDQTDDCAAASLGAAWGKDCDLKQEEDSDTGWSSVFVSSTADNSCAYGHGQALAQEGLLGSWSSCTVSPWVLGFTRSLHDVCGDTHNYKAWAKASVDGKSKAKTGSSPGAAPSRIDPASVSPLAAWPPGTVLVVAKIDNLTLDSGNLKTNSSQFTGTLKINGQTRWAVTARLDKTGRVLTTGPLSPRQFRVTQDATTGKYTAQIANYRYEIPVDTLAFAGAPGSLSTLSTAADTETDVSVSMESEVEADGGDGGGAVCTGDATVTCAQAMTTASDGSYVYEGQTLNLGNVTIVNVISTNPVLNLTVQDATGTLYVVDPFHASSLWHAGAKVHLTGVLSLYNGDPVLTNVTLTPPFVEIGPTPIKNGEGGRGGHEIPTLDQNDPNPFNPVTSIHFNMARPGRADLGIFAINGRLVRQLVSGTVAAGGHDVLWNGRDDLGSPLPSGVYFYRLAADGRAIVKRMIMIK